MRIWSILLIESDLKWCIHLSSSLLLYFKRSNMIESHTMTALVSLPSWITALVAVSIASIARPIVTTSYWTCVVTSCTIKLCLADSVFTYAIILVTVSISPTLKTIFFTDSAVISYITRYTVSICFTARTITATFHTRLRASISVKSWFTSCTFGFRWASDTICRINRTRCNETNSNLKFQNRRPNISIHFNNTDKY